MPIIANTTSANTFSAVRAQLNSVTKRMNQFAVNESTFYANTLYANVAFTAKGTATVTGLFTASGRATVGTNLTVSGNTTVSGTLTTSNFTAKQVGGDEGGQLDLELAATNTTLTGGVAIDIYQNRLRIFEKGGSIRGAYIDLSTLASGVGSTLSANRVVSYADQNNITITADNTDTAVQTYTGAAGTFTVNAPTGSPVNGQKVLYRLTTTNAMTFSWNAIFRGSTDLTLPTSSSGSSKTDYLAFIYNSAASKWDLLAKNFGY